MTAQEEVIAFLNLIYLATLQEVDHIRPQTRTKPPEISDPLDGLPPVFPKPAKYTLTYEKPGVGQRRYTISNPIAANKDSIVAYCFATDGVRPGVKTFKKQRIVAVRKL